MDWPLTCLDSMVEARQDTCKRMGGGLGFEMDREESFLEEVVDAFDAAFDAATGGGLPGCEMTSPAIQLGKEEAADTLFAEIAAEHAQPVKNFIFRLQRGTANKTWIRFCQPVLRSIQSAAQTMELYEPAAKIAEFDEVLCWSERQPGHWLLADTRDQLLAAYEELVVSLPRAFQLSEESLEREELILQSLLKQVPGFGKVSLEKLQRAGLWSLHVLIMADRTDLASAAGLPLRVADRICQKVRHYREEIAGLPPEFAKTELRSRLSDVVKELHELETRQPSGSSTAKRSQRALRERKTRQMTLLLAELGEVKRVRSLKKLPIKKRMLELEKYLTS
jgi:hypothetical protein